MIREIERVGTHVLHDRPERLISVRRDGLDFEVAILGRFWLHLSKFDLDDTRSPESIRAAFRRELEWIAHREAERNLLMSLLIRLKARLTISRRRQPPFDESYNDSFAELPNRELAEQIQKRIVEDSGESSAIFASLIDNKTVTPALLIAEVERLLEWAQAHPEPTRNVKHGNGYVR